MMMSASTRPLPLLHHAETGDFEHHTYHVDVRFELAFTQPAILADAVHKAMQDGCRIVVEHFELLYPVLKQNADVLVGSGRGDHCHPSLFGPLPEEIKSIVYESLYHRKMAHSAECDITQMVLQRMGVPKADGHDVRHGFILCYLKQPRWILLLWMNWSRDHRQRLPHYSGGLIQ